MRRAGLLVLVLAAVIARSGLAAAKPSPGSSVTISASSAQVVYGSQATITGQATGKNNGAATITLYAKSAPAYSAAKSAATTTTSATGQYSFTIAPTTSAVYFVKVHTAPQATSSGVAVKVAVKITLSLTGGAGHMFFSGSVLPSYAGKSVLIERLSAGGWKTVANATLVSAASIHTALGATTRSKYRKRLRLKSGSYRAFFDPADGLQVANASPSRRI